MAAELARTLLRLINPGSITGPIFGKELRVSSRRKRNYVVRTAYVALMALFIIFTWMMSMDEIGSAWSRVQMARVGRFIVAAIVLFQFCATQLIVVCMFSTAISDEIYRRTLGLLMTTPINSFQIIMGKLFSKLLQLLILLAISLPMLAVVRVFGGVPWEFVVAALCVTVTAAVFAGSVSMFFSIGNRRAYVAILKAIFTLLALFLVVPFVTEALWRPRPQWLSMVLTYANPWGAMARVFRNFVSPFPAALSWQVHCLVMLGASGAVLAVCTAVVRKVGLRQATSEAGLFVRRRQRRPKAAVAGGEQAAGRIRRVRGSPVVWRELRTPMYRSRLKGIIGAGMVIGGLGATYLACAESLDAGVTHLVYAIIFIGIGGVATAVLSATSITSEKEARTLPILLGTPLSDLHLIAGKAMGVFRRCVPVWLLLGGHMLLFTILGFVHPIVLVHLAMLVVWLVLFLTGTGMYFSARLRRTTAAVMANLGLALALWAVLPILLGLTMALSKGDSDYINIVFCANPVVQGTVVTIAGAGEDQASESIEGLEYHWPDDSVGPYAGAPGAGDTTARMFVSILGYGLVGLAFALRAKAHLRRKLF